MKLFKNRMARNAGWIVVCKGVQAVLGLLISMLTTRYLGPEKYGLISYAASLVLFLNPAAQLGFTSTLVHELIRKPEEEGKILGSAILMSLISSLVCILGVSVFVSAANPAEPVTIRVCQLYALLLLSQGLELVQYWFQSKLLSKYTALVTLIVYVLVSAYQIVILMTGKNLYLFAISKALQHGVIAAVLLAIYHRLGGQKLSLSIGHAGEMLGRSRHYILSSLMVMTFGQADRIMIKNMIGDEAMGFYAAAVMCANATDFVFNAVIDSVRPFVLEARRRDRKVYEAGVSAMYSIVIYLSLIQSVFIALLAEPIISILCGRAYLPAAGTLRIIVWYTAFSYIGSARNVWIMAEEKHRLLWRINLSGALLNVFLNLVMIPVWGIEGAAFTSLLTQIFVNVGIGYLIAPLRENNRFLHAAMNPRIIYQFLKRQS